MGVKHWKPKNLRKNTVYRLKIPGTTIKHREMRALLDGQEVEVLKQIGWHGRHGTYKVRLLNATAFPKNMPREFKIWGPYICCNCDWVTTHGCTCGGY